MFRSFAVPLAALIGLTLAAPGHAADDAQKITREILDKAVTALGGADNLGKLKAATWKSKGKVTFENTEVTLSEDWSAKGVDKYNIAVNATIGGNTVNGTLIFNADKGWAKTDKTNDVPKEAAGAIRNVIRASRIFHLMTILKEKPYDLSPLGELKVGDHDAVGIRVGHKGYPDVSLYFDKKTGLPLKSEVRVIEMDGGPEVLFEAYFTDYKDFEGIKHATKVTVKRDDKPFLESELSDLKPQDLDDSLFDKP